MADNSSRRTRQKELDIRVIVGNPPYSVGQGNANDNAANLSYPKLDRRIRNTYAERSTATLKNSLYDSYIRALRWASDRIGDAGVIAYISNAGWVDGSAADGLRKCLAEEFSNIHVFHLRGNQRTSGDRSKREGGKIFGSGSRAPIAISVLVKNPSATQHGRIRFHDIGDYLSREEKLAVISRFGSIGGIEHDNGWREIVPDEHGDWLNLRDSGFADFISIGDKKGSGDTCVFETYFNGLKTGRDVWCFNSSPSSGAEAADKMLTFFNSEVSRYNKAGSPSEVDRFIDVDPRKFSWNRMARQKLARHSVLSNATLHSSMSLYRPFYKQNLHAYLDITDLATVVRNAFPSDDCRNRAIIIPGNGAAAGFTPLMVDVAPSLQPYHNTQCFPRYLYGRETEVEDDVQGDLLMAGNSQRVGRQRRDAITDKGLAHFQTAYPADTISKDDLFYYVYGLLHSEEYCARFADNLSRQLPRIPAVKKATDFWAFAEAGRKLGDLHCGYEEVEPYPVTFKQGSLTLAIIKDPGAFYRVEKMKFGGKRPNVDKTTVVYNSNITMTGVPLEAYDYVVNGKPALEWVMERQGVKTDAASGIVNDANRYAIETIGDPAYPLKLFQRVITVSLETMKIVRALPKLEI